MHLAATTPRLNENSHHARRFVNDTVHNKAAQVTASPKRSALDNPLQREVIDAEDPHGADRGIRQGPG